MLWPDNLQSRLGRKVVHEWTTYAPLVQIERGFFFVAPKCVRNLWYQDHLTQTF